MSELLGPRHPDVRALRDILRDRGARDEARRFALEGPRLLAAALDRDTDDLVCFFDPRAEDRWPDLLARARARGARMRGLADGVAGRVGDTVTSQGVITTAPLVRRGGEVIAELAPDSLMVVCVAVSDPGNAGTLVRSAEAAGFDAVLFGEGSVDAYNPKTVRASAGAVLGVPIAEGVNAVEILEALGERGVRRIGTVATGGDPYDSIDLRGPAAVVLGHEARGLGAGMPLDALVTIPMSGRAESLNLATAAGVLFFEAARARRTREARP
ncbi:MAG: RNA methyltransferase [Acidimicrobiia bacterium]|nr:RNA methyltransferase [Acidimicrobiia bacterium]